MLWSLWRIYILFTETFKVKINTYFLFWNNYLLHGLVFVKNVPISNIWIIIEKGKHLIFPMGAIQK